RKHQALVGQPTDDAERTLAVARAILRDGVVRHASVGRELLSCTKSVHPGGDRSGNFTRPATRPEGRSIAMGGVPLSAWRPLAFCTARTASMTSLKGRTRHRFQPTEVPWRSRRR